MARSVLRRPIHGSIGEDYDRMPRRVKDSSYWHPVTVPWFNINCTKRLPLIGKYEILQSADECPFGHRLALEGAFGLVFRQDAGHIDIPRAPFPSVRLRKMLSGKERGCSVLWELRRLCRMCLPSPSVPSEFFPRMHIYQNEIRETVCIQSDNRSRGNYTVRMRLREKVRINSWIRKI